ncbi:MAG: hypothetical protein COA85_00995 [Robiginitomaculum sp.]|nr:MAG: hypothetical protein COA85_00995 [Robiginitomaculum sp.]
MILALRQTKGEASKGNLWRFCLAIAFYITALSLFMPAPAQAHRAHAGLTEIVWNAHTQEMEITHRLYAHDLEPRLFSHVLSGWEETQEGVERVGEYCTVKFQIRDKGQPVPLSYVGAEPEGEFIYVYFTAPRPAEGDSLSIYNAMLMDAFDDQVNLVNLTLDGKTQSQYFRFGEAAKPLVWTLPNAD